MKKLAFTLAMLLALAPAASARNGGQKVRHLDFVEDSSLSVTLEGSITESSTAQFEWSEYEGDDFRAYVLAVVKGDDSSRRRVELLKSNKQGDPHANKYDFGTDNGANNDDSSDDSSQSNNGGLLAMATTDSSFLASSGSGRDGDDDDDDDEDEDDEDEDDDSDDDDSDDDRFRSRRAVIATIDDQSVVSFETRIPAGSHEYVLCVVTTNNTAGCSASIELVRDPSQDEIAREQKMIRFENFRDTGGHWSEDHIRRLVKAGVIDVDQDDFRPNDEITRAEAIKMIIVGAGLEAYQCDEDIFPDVEADDWFCAFATAAYDEGIAEGENGYLNPNARLNRAQAVKLVLVAKGISVENVEDTEGEFPDVEPGEWFSKFAKKAKELGIISGKDKGGQKIFDPGAPITRAELAKIIDVAFN